MRIAAIVIAAWVSLSIPASLFIAKMFAVGRDADRRSRMHEAESEKDISRKAA
jgi:hypothetical protein